MLVEAEILRTAKSRSDFDEDKELFLECGDEWKRDSVRQT